ncbi:tannase/feruloyl esterase family alpha/beta hydrolase [Novosphingobium pokkalii]|uniref:Tannase/feruloyl esterase family alpha/beta hydrolase n=1 Tax=Novosphingobium pokkalii TaxID=1770194 RepID=A0ABV7V2G7_9SPHN|nr:tannase/feruloyl esterase family alpha/beta hydrolase [Novosphingobium pokkalii]GHC83376.1 feruloyl esterase [Novosphingobium pokkalii]
MLKTIMLALAAWFAMAGGGGLAQAKGLAPLAPVAPVAACADLARIDLSGATGAPTRQEAKSVTEAGAKPYCQVSGTIAPAIRFEVRLPLDGWTQRYLQTGCGGLCGNLRIDAGKAEGCAPVTDGSIVLASTDMGHQGMDTAWGNDPQKRRDFAERGVHVTALAAKALIKAFYGRDPRYSYFSGCSDGGREALIEAQRYPQDFDGIAAGAPALNFTIQNSFHHGWLAKVNTGADGKPVLLAADMAPLHKAALAACDGNDGLVDGQITDPRTCRVDPAVTLCKGAYQPGKCLTAAKVEAARLIYQGARTAQGQPLEVGPLQPGSEMNWIGVFVPMNADGPIMSGMFASDTINHLLFTPNPATPYTPQTFPFTLDMVAQEQPARALYNADNPDLSGFAGRGGKLILWHGWGDPHISPINTIAYFDKVGEAMGAPTRDGFVRMFLFPGMGHCSGGDGPSEFPLLQGLMAWVESGEAPAVMVAHRAKPTHEGAPLPADGPMKPPPGATGMPKLPMMPMMPPQPTLPPRSRPVFAYPAVAHYKGTGSIDEAASFEARP